jgi:hypothetical protein
MKYILVAMLFVFSTVMAKDKIVCKAKSANGEQCKSPFVNKELGYCNIHNPNRPKCQGKNKKGNACGMMVSKNENLCRIHKNQ